MPNITGDGNHLNETDDEARGQNLSTTDILLSVVNIFLSIAAFLSNALILTALHKVSSIYPPTKLLFRCLAVSDLFVGLLVQPMSVASFFSFSSIISNGLNIFLPLLTEITILTSSAISVDRLLALLLGLRYRHVVTLRRVRVVMLCIWLVAVVPGSLTFFIPFHICFKLFLTLIILCLVISFVSNTKIFFILRHQQTQLRDSSQKGQPNVEGIPQNIARYKKTVSTIIWVQLVSVACYAPYVITSIIPTFLNVDSKVVNISSFTLTLLYLNSSLNPILYCWKIRDVRQQVKSTIREFLCVSN